MIERQIVRDTTTVASGRCNFICGRFLSLVGYGLIVYEGGLRCFVNARFSFAPENWNRQELFLGGEGGEQNSVRSWRSKMRAEKKA